MQQKNEKYRNNMESLTLQANGPRTERAYIRGGGGGSAYNLNIFSGPITRGTDKQGGL